jgi:hypothetical protein
MSGAARTLKRMPRWVWFGVPAGIAFASAVIASLVGGSSGPEAHSAPTPVATQAPLPKPPEAKAEAKPVAVEAPADAAPHATVRPAAPPPVKVAKQPARPALHPAQKRQSARAAELKNPFR